MGLSQRECKHKNPVFDCQIYLKGEAEASLPLKKLEYKNPSFIIILLVMI